MIKNPSTAQIKLKMFPVFELDPGSEYLAMTQTTKMYVLGLAGGIFRIYILVMFSLLNLAWMFTDGITSLRDLQRNLSPCYINLE